MIQALRNAIYVTGQTASGISSSNLFFDEMEEGTAFPYVVYADVTDFVTRDSATDIENQDIQFIVFSDVLTECETFGAALKVKFDYGKDNLSVSEYNVVECVRILEIGATKNDKIWNYILQYRITISKSR